MKLVKKNNFFLLFIIMLFSFGFNGISVKAEGEHQFSLKAYDWNAFDNDWEGSGTGEEISNNGTIEPGKVYKLSIYYIPGTITEVGMQMGIKYNNLLIEPMYADGELYTETDMSTTYQGGIWPASGTTPSAKKKTNWQVLSNDAIDESMFTFMATDTTTSNALETEGEIASVYFKVKDTVTSGTNIIFEYDDEYTALNNDRPKVTSGINLTVQTALSSNSALHTLSVTNSETTYNLTPTFTADDNTIKEYSTVVPSSVTSVDLSATATDSNASVLSGGLGIKELNIGNNDFNIVVTAGDGSITTYKVSVYRLNDDATLKSLDLTNNVNIGEFNSATTEYEASVPYATKNTVVSATTTDQNASIKSGTGSFEFTNYGTTPNTKEIIVNAENCKEEYASVPNNACTTKTYTVTVNRENPSNNNYLSNLKVNGQTVTDFNKEKLEYTLDDVKGDVSSIEVSATAEDTKASVSGTGNKSLSTGDNSIEVVVTAEDGSTKTYTIKVKKLSNDIALKSLTVTSNPMGTLTPSFASTTYAYTYNYDATVTSLNVTATTNNTNAKVGIIDSDSSDIMTSTIGSAAKTFNSSTKNVKVTVTAEDGTTKDYTIVLSRDKSTDATLDSLTVSEGTLTPTFNKNTLNYTINVNNDVTSIDVNATTTDSNATVTGTGTKQLNTGNNLINIVVKSESGTVNTYTINVIRAKSSNNYLSDLKVNGQTVTDFNKEKLEYTLDDVKGDVSSIEVSATAEDTKASVVGTGNKSLSIGDNSIEVVVTAEDESTKTYTIKVKKLSNDIALKSLTVTSDPMGTLTPTFASTTYIYTYNYDSSVTSLNVTATTNNLNAKVGIADSDSIDTITSTIGSAAKTFNSSTKNVKVTVTAEDGTTKDYTITLSRALSNNSYLKDISIDGTNIDGFNKENFEYNIKVSRETDSINISAILDDEKATLTTDLSNKFNLNLGENIINIVVTAENGNTSTYILNVEREKNNDATLDSLTVSKGTLTPAFNKNTLNYTVNVENDVTSIEVSATATDSNATVTGTGTKQLNTGDNTVTIKVTSESGTENTYTINVIRAKSSNNYLSDLKVNGQTVNNFNKETEEYTLADVKGDVSSIEVSAIAEDTKASVTGTGNKLLSIGDNSIEVVVTAEDGSTKTYTIKVKKLSNDIALKSLTVTSDPMGTLTPIFASTTYAYTYNYDATVTNLNVTATTNDLNAKVGIVDSDSIDTITSTVGIATKTFNSNVKNVKVTVTAEDGSTKDYTITLSRALSNNSYLKDISIDGTNIDGFNKENFEYNIKVSRETDSINISAILDDEKATLTTDLSNKFNLNLGENIINIVVTAENGNTSTYILNVEREKNNDATLDSLTVSKGTLTPAFNKNTLNYTVNVENDVTSIEVSATATDSNATVTGIGTKELNTGDNTVTIKVTSESGSENTYTINVIRAKSSNNNLTDIKVDGNSIENFSSNTLKYNLPKVSYSKTSINVEAILSDPKASVTGVGNISLNTGDNKIEIVVTAEDGSTKTYELNIEREKNNNAKLQSLSIGNYTLTPAFNKDTLEYTVTVGEDVNILNQDDVIAIPEDNNATVVKQGNLELSTTSDNYYRVTVTAENGVDKNVYAIKVIRPKSSDATLKSLEIIGGKLTPTFNKDTLEYNVTMGKDVTKFNKDNIKVSINNGNAKISYNNEIIINSDTFTKYIITVTAENGSKKEYILNVKVDTELDKITSSSHTINDEYIKTVRLYETGRELKDELDNDNAYLEIWTSDESRKVEDDEKLSTGMIVKLVINGVLKDRKIIVIRGDTSGDGEIDLLDAVKILNNALQKAMLDGAYKEAAFVNNDDEIDLLDAVMILNHCLQKQPLY